MKKILALLLVLVMAFSLVACTSTAPKTDPTPDLIVDQVEETPELVPDETPEVKEPVEIIVFAAASMKETLEAIGAVYEDANPHVTLVFNFDSSGTLKTQIAEGADCDVFISAAQRQMNELDIEADAAINVDGLDIVMQGTRINLLENKVALAVPEGNPAGLESYDMLMELLESGEITLAIGNSDVPVGQYTEKIFEYYEIDMASVEKNLTFGSNVKEVTTHVSESLVSCGIIYATDAVSAGLQIVDTATAEMCGQVIYPAAVLNTTESADEAEAFLAFLLTAEAETIFDSVGFTVVK